MQLFCEECFTYIGPQNFTNCPYCGCDLKNNLPVLEPGKPFWENPAVLPGHPIARPVYSNGLILITWRKGKWSGGLSAFDQDGRLVWRVFCGEIPIGGVSVCDEWAYFCTNGVLDGGTVFCCKITTTNPDGEIIWTRRGSFVPQSTIILKQARLFIPCHGGNILCLDAKTGQIVPGWEGKIETDIHWLLESTRSLIGINKDSGRIVYVDPYRGRQDGPTIFLNSKIPCIPSIFNDELYFCNNDGNIIKFNLRIRTFQVFENKQSKFFSSPLIKQGIIYAGSLDHNVYAWNESGTLLWRSDFSCEHAISSSPALGNNILAIGANDGKVYGLDSTSGKKIWVFDCGHGNAFLRDVLFYNDVFYWGMISPGKSSGYLYALPWHLGEYEKVAKMYASEGNILESANFYAVAAHFAIKGRQELEENAANGWVECGKPGMAVQYWLGMAKPEMAAKCWETAAESFRGRNNTVAAEQYYQASRIYWRIGDVVNEKSCIHKAVELGRWPLLRLKVLNNPLQTIGKTGQLTIRVENIGYSQASNLHFDVGGSLLNPVCFDMVAPLEPDRYCDLSFEISATRENDTVNVEISYFGKGRSVPFHINLDILVQAKKVTTIKMDGIVKSEVRIINDDGNDMEIIAQDMVFSQLQIINKK